MLNHKLPKISIVTPSYNQGKYIEETILSVIGQGYPNLEYIIIDGGSTDNTIEIIKKYEKYINYWISEKDHGQSHAINKGFEIASGDIIGWLNSDDLYLPGALFTIAQKTNIFEKSIYYGNCIHFKQGKSGVDSWGSDVIYLSNETVLENIDFIIQPSSFWTKRVWEEVGKLNEDIHYAFDWEWFLRAKKSGVPFYSLSKCLSMYRMHEEHKTGTGGSKRQEEILKIYKLYSHRFARLYESLLNEDINNPSLEKKIISKMFKVIGLPKSKIDIIKIVKPKLYREYSSKEIEFMLAML